MVQLQLLRGQQRPRHGRALGPWRLLRRGRLLLWLLWLLRWRLPRRLLGRQLLLLLLLLLLAGLALLGNQLQPLLLLGRERGKDAALLLVLLLLAGLLCLLCLQRLLRCLLCLLLLCLLLLC